MRGEVIGFFIIKQIEKPRLCFVLLESTYEVVEHSRSREKHSTASRVFPNTSFVLYRFLRALQHNRAQSRLLYLLTE